MRFLSLLVGSAILSVATTSCFATIAVLSGTVLAPQSALAGLPYALYFVGLVVSTVATARIAATRGRRHALVLAQLVGVGGAVLAAISLQAGIFQLLCVATILFGYFAGASVSTRFFAAELAGPEHAMRAIGLVMGSGLIGGIAGPMISAYTGLDAAGLARSYWIIAAVITGCVALIAATPASRPTRQPAIPIGQAVALLFADRALRQAALANVLAWALMSSIMGAGPAAMRAQGVGQHLISAGMQIHFLAMYIPALLAMTLGARMPSRTISLWAGLFALVMSCGTSLGLGLTSGVFIVTLACAGIGWGLVVVTNSAIFATVPIEQRFAVQGANDFLAYGVSAVAAMGSGWLVTIGGWPSLAEAGLVALACYALYLLVDRIIARAAVAAP